MKYPISLGTLLATLLTSYSTYGMTPRPLGKIEKQIFLREVKRIGKKVALLQIKKTKDPQLCIKNDKCRLMLFPCFTITTHIKNQTTDALYKLIITKIKEKEAKNGYIPEHIQKTTSTAVSSIMPNNFLENYTCYWHKKDHTNIPYIELLSNFNDKKSLLDVLNQE